MQTVQHPNPGSVFTPNNAAAARNVISTEGAALVLYFTKADGTERRMFARYTGATSRTASTMVLWDCEKGAFRTVRLDRVHTIKVVSARRSEPKQAPDRKAAPGQKSPKLQAMVDELAGFC